MKIIIITIHYSLVLFKRSGNIGKPVVTTTRGERSGIVSSTLPGYRESSSCRGHILGRCRRTDHRQGPKGFTFTLGFFGGVVRFKVETEKKISKYPRFFFYVFLLYIFLHIFFFSVVPSS